MPPRLTIPIFGERKVFIASINGGEYHELKEVLKNTSLSEGEDAAPEKTPIFNPPEYAFSMVFKNPFDPRELIRQTGILMGFRIRKPRKTTYKTLRHDCAKRNGRR